MAETDDGERPRRRYHSPARQAQAAETRSRVIDAAADVFASAGYDGATVPKIAARAKVSPDTVMTVGNKAFLLLEAFRLRALGEGGPETLMERSFAHEIFAITDPAEGLAAVVGFMAAAHAGSADLWTIIHAAAPTEPLVADVLDELKKSRDASYEITLDWLVSIGAVTAPDDWAAFIVEGMLALSAEQYLQLTQDWGMDLAAYRDWLTRKLRSGLA